MSTASDSQFLVDMAWDMEKRARERLAVARTLADIGNRLSGQSGTLMPTSVAEELTKGLEKQRREADDR